MKALQRPHQNKKNIRPFSPKYSFSFFLPPLKEVKQGVSFPEAAKHHRSITRQITLEYMYADVWDPLSINPSTQNCIFP